MFITVIMMGRDDEEVGNISKQGTEYKTAEMFELYLMLFDWTTRLKPSKRISRAGRRKTSWPTSGFCRMMENMQIQTHQLF